jgi:hypothetical protein
MGTVQAGAILPTMALAVVAALGACAETKRVAMGEAPAKDVRSRLRTTLSQVVFSGFFAAALAACASNPPEQQVGPPPGMETAAPESAPPTLHGKAPSGFVDMREVEIAYLGEAGGGKGTLTFQGQTYPFEIAGLGGGGVGVSTIDATGEVYNLTDVAQFSGAYGEGRYGAVVGDASTGDLWLKNNAGVVMHLKAKREGLMLSLGADVVDIRMSQ